MLVALQIDTQLEHGSPCHNVHPDILPLRTDRRCNLRSIWKLQLLYSRLTLHTFDTRGTHMRECTGLRPDREPSWSAYIHGTVAHDVELSSAPMPEHVANLLSHDPLPGIVLQEEELLRGNKMMFRTPTAKKSHIGPGPRQP